MRAAPILLAAALAAPASVLAAAPPPPEFLLAGEGRCIACHQVPEGAGPATRADLGPKLEGGRMRTLGRERIRALIEDPMRANPDTVMPPYGRHRILDRAEIDRLVEYLLALP